MSWQGKLFRRPQGVGRGPSVERPDLAAVHWWMSLAGNTAPWAASLGAAAGFGHALLAKDFNQRMDELLSANVGRLAIQPQLDVSGLYTDNLFYGSEDRQVADLAGILSPGLRLQYGADGGNQAALDYTHDEFVYVDNSGANTRQDRIAFQVGYGSGRFRVDGSDGIDFLSGFISGSGIGTLQLTPVDRRIWRDNYRFTWDSTLKTDVYVDGSHYDEDFAETVALLDQNTLRGALGGSFKYSDRVAFFTEGFYGQSAVSPNATPTGGPYSQFFGGYLGARGNFTTKLSGSVKLGYELREFSDGISQGANTPAVAADLTYAPTTRNSLQLRYDRRTTPGPQFGGQSAVGDTVTFRASQFLGRGSRWMLQANARYDLLDLGDSIQIAPLSTPFGTVLAPINVARLDTLWSAGLALYYQPKAWLTTILSYQHESFSPDLVDPLAQLIFLIPKYTVNSVTLTVSVGY